MPFVPNIAGGPPGLFDVEQDFYGRDLFFDGDLHVGPNGDYVTVDGIENLRQALIRRAIVRPGEYRARPNYGAGLMTYVKKRFTASSKAEIEKRLAEQWALDDRVESVSSVVVEEVTVNAQTFFRVSFAVVTGGQRRTFQPFLVPRQV